MTLTRDDCAAIDRADPLATLREQFHLPEGLVYLDGNSLGPLPRTTPARVAEVMTQEWGQGPTGRRKRHGWETRPKRVEHHVGRPCGARGGRAGGDGPGATFLTEPLDTGAQLPLLFQQIAALFGVISQAPPASRR